MGSITKIPERKKRRFVQEDFVVTDWSELEPYFNRLLNAPLDDVPSLEAWLRQVSELEFVVHEDKAWRYIRMTCDTENETYRAAYDDFTTNILPHLSRAGNGLLNKLYASPAFAELDSEAWKVLIRTTRNRIELFRDANIPLLTEARTRAREFDELAGALHVVLDGKKLTLQKAASMLESPDRTFREKIWRKITSARLGNRDKLNALYSDLVRLRTQIARNAGYQSYSDYKFVELGRFDYDRSACYEFHRSIEKVIQPVLKAQSAERQQLLGLDELRHWDLSVDPRGEAALKPFADTDELIEKSIRVFDRLDPRLGAQIRIMREMGHLDLTSRLGKAPGGYNYPLPETGVPFIFMNAVGTQSDLTTMLHEGGHAVHSFATRPIDISNFRNLPSEIAELASMSMELLTLDFWDEFYDDPETLRRAKREQLIRPFSLLPWIAAIDAFQLWAYDHPGHSVEEREATWKELFLRFHGDFVQWDGDEDVLASLWQKQGHVFDVPFYYIEYGIAQFGAIAVWRNYRRNPEKGLQDYLNALALGYKRPIPEVYEAAGIRFDFSEDYIRELVDFVMEELEAIENAGN